MPEPWMSTYPTVAAVQAAHINTLCAWHENLPPAQTDVERTVRRRICCAIDAHLAVEAPEVFAAIEQLRAGLAEAGITLQGNIFSPQEPPQ